MSAMLELDLEDDNEVTDRVVGTTKGGKDIVIYWDVTGYCRCKFTSGGQLPARLRGRFTRYEIAEDHVKAYLAAEEDYLRKEALKKAEQEVVEAARAAEKRATQAEEARLIQEMQERAAASMTAALEDEAKITASKSKTTKKVTKKNAEDRSES